MAPDRVRPGIHSDEPGVRREFTDTTTPTVAEWAQGVWDSFQGQPIGKKPERKRAINGLRKELFRAVSTPEGQPQHLVRNPQGLEDTFSTWIARTDPRNERSRLFMEVVQEECNEFARKHWDEITPVELGQLVSVTANTTLAERELSDVLRNYFRGPRTPEQRVDANFKLSEGALDLINDKKAVGLAVRIGFFETDILPRGSMTHGDMALAAMDVNNLPLLEKTLLTDMILADLGYVFDVMPRGVNERNRVALEKSAYYQPRWEEQRELIIRATISDPELARRARQLNEHHQRPTETFTAINLGKDAPARDESLKWLDDITINSSNPLVKRFEEQLGPRFRVKHLVERAKQGAARYTVGEVVSVPIYEHTAVEICLPEGCSAEDRQAFLQVTFNNILMEREYIEQKRADEDSQYTLAGIIQTRYVESNGQRIVYFARQTTVPERTQRHPLFDLAITGLPVPEVPDSAKQETQRIQDEIKKYQRRFLNRRGIRVGFYNPRITERGYSHVDFRKGDEPGSTHVTIYNGNKSYDVRLDKNHNLDFEGRTLIAPQFEESLQYYLVRILKDYFCKESLESSEGTIVDREGLVQARIPHLRLLRPGHRSGLDQRKAYLEEEGGDLIAKSEERKALLGTDRNTTYVRAVVKEEDETLEPITVHIDAV